MFDGVLKSGHRMNLANNKTALQHLQNLSNSTLNNGQRLRIGLVLGRHGLEQPVVRNPTSACYAAHDDEPEVDWCWFTLDLYAGLNRSDTYNMHFRANFNDPEALSELAGQFDGVVVDWSTARYLNFKVNNVQAWITLLRENQDDRRHAWLALETAVASVVVSNTSPHGWTLENPAHRQLCPTKDVEAISIFHQVREPKKKGSMLTTSSHVIPATSISVENQRLVDLLNPVVRRDTLACLLKSQQAESLQPFTDPKGGFPIQTRNPVLNWIYVTKMSGYNF